LEERISKESQFVHIEMLGFTEERCRHILQEPKKVPERDGHLRRSEKKGSFFDQEKKNKKIKILRSEKQMKLR
jgi:hypothetical protein